MKFWIDVILISLPFICLGYWFYVFIYKGIIKAPKYDIDNLKMAFESYHIHLLSEERYEEIMDVLKILSSLENGIVLKIVKNYHIHTIEGEVTEYHNFISHPVLVVKTFYKVLDKKS